MANGLDTPIGDTRKRMALTPAEVALVETHRRNTEVDRAYNAGLDEAVAAVLRENIGWIGTDHALSDVQFRDIQQAIRSAKREV